MITPPVVIVRHPRERVAKCSLEPLNGRPGFEFHRGTHGFRYDGSAHLLLAVGAAPVTREDAFLDPSEASALAGAGRKVLHDEQGRPLRPLLLLDSTWRLLPALRGKIIGRPLERSLPTWIRTAYPRVSKLGFDPDSGLASVEALYAALHLMGYERQDVLDAYRWREPFLAHLANSPAL